MTRSLSQIFALSCLWEIQGKPDSVTLVARTIPIQHHRCCYVRYQYRYRYRMEVALKLSRVMHAVVRSGRGLDRNHRYERSSPLSAWRDGLRCDEESVRAQSQHGSREGRRQRHHGPSLATDVASTASSSSAGDWGATITRVVPRCQSHETQGGFSKQIGEALSGESSFLLLLLLLLYCCHCINLSLDCSCRVCLHSTAYSLTETSSTMKQTTRIPPAVTNYTYGACYWCHDRSAPHPCHHSDSAGMFRNRPLFSCTSRKRKTEKFQFSTLLETQVDFPNFPVFSFYHPHPPHFLTLV